jgi:MFS family permease
MDPRRAGLTVTPLVVCITLGSITSARVVTRLPSATTVLYVGFALLTLCCAGVILSGKSVGQTGLMMWMALGGLGLGCILPNLTVFAQEQAGRGSLGTATALLQSVRMMGGMLGAALTGALVTHFYSGAVHAGLEQANALQWYARVVDPQILINQKDQTALLAELARDGHNGGAILELARNALVNAIHLGLALAGAVAAWSIWQLRRVPAIRFKKRHEAAAGEAAGKEEKAASHGGMTGTNRGE